MATVRGEAKFAGVSSNSPMGQQLRKKFVKVVGMCEAEMKKFSAKVSKDCQCNAPTNHQDAKDSRDLVALGLGLKVTTFQRLCVIFHAAKDALERLDKGIYGVCIDCGEPMLCKRLAKEPFAKRCIGCQESAEKEAGYSRTRSAHP